MIVAEHINGPLHWEQLGKSGRPIAFVHPNPMDHTCWLYQMAHLSTWFRCIGIDLPGYGKSPTAQKGLTMQDVAQACWEAVDEVTDEPAIIVGESVGSNVVQHMANQRPERTLAVVVSGTGYGGDKSFTVKRRGEYSERGVAFRHDHTFQDYSAAFRASPLASYFAQIYVERNAWADADTIVEMFRALGEPDPEWLHSGIRAPMLIITGSEDNSHQTAWELQRHVRDCELVTIGGAGHSCNMERPWEWDAHFLDFLTRRGLFEGVSLGGALAATGAPIIGRGVPVGSA
jgi:pimeloyl-ACP methyl ester carboxylesterase